MLAFCLTEPEAGSDSAAVKTNYREDGDCYVLNGRKSFISNGDLADIFFVGATKDRSLGNKGISLFMVERKDGIINGKHEDKMGMRLSGTADVVFDEVRIPKDRLIGAEGRGLGYLLKFLDIVRVTTMSFGLGGAQHAFDLAVDYANTRVQFGKPIIANQGIQFKLADIQARLHAARAVIMYAAKCIDDKVPMGDLSASAKLISSEFMNSIVYDALQVMGGYGYMKEYPMEKIYRDMRIFPIFEGTNEIQKIVIGRGLVK